VYSEHIQRVLAIPSKRHDKRQVHFLTRSEIEALLAAPDRTTSLGRRDHALLLLGVQTGLRLSELIGLDKEAVTLGRGAHVRCIGKGRKERCTPLTSHAVSALQAWLKEPSRHGAQALFPNIHGSRLSAVGVQYLIGKYVKIAREQCPSLVQSECRRMSLGTVPPWSSYKPASIVPSSPCGWAMSRSKPPRYICMPISL